MTSTSTPLPAGQVGTNAGEAPIEAVPVDGAPPASAEVAEQNTMLLIVLPVVLLVVGTLLYLVKRRPAGATGEASGGERGGLVLMAVGAGLTGLMLLYLMLGN